MTRRQSSLIPLSPSFKGTRVIRNVMNPSSNYSEHRENESTFINYQGQFQSLLISEIAREIAGRRVRNAVFSTL